MQQFAGWGKLGPTALESVSQSAGYNESGPDGEYI